MKKYGIILILTTLIFSCNQISEEHKLIRDGFINQNYEKGLTNDNSSESIQHNELQQDQVLGKFVYSKKLIKKHSQSQQFTILERPDYQSYHDIAVQAIRLLPENRFEKILFFEYKSFNYSLEAEEVFPIDYLRMEWPEEPDSCLVIPENIIDVSQNLKGDSLLWSIPDGKWMIIRYGFIESKSTSPDLSTWRADFLSKFNEYRCYDPKPFLPVLTNLIVRSREESNQFLSDYRQTITDYMERDLDRESYRLTDVGTTEPTRYRWVKSKTIPVQDILFYYCDDFPQVVYNRVKEPNLYKGYHSSFCTSDNDLQSLLVVDGSIQFPNQTGYSLLVLPEDGIVSLSVLKKVKEMAEQGAKILGPKSFKSKGWLNKQQKEEFRDLIFDLLGGGKILFGIHLEQALSQLNISPDLKFSGDKTDCLLEFEHRQTEDSEFYFVTNQRKPDNPADTVGIADRVKLSFRIEKGSPEYWNPKTGEVTSIDEYSRFEGRTIIPWDFRAQEQGLFVFLMN